MMDSLQGFIRAVPFSYIQKTEKENKGERILLDQILFI